MPTWNSVTPSLEAFVFLKSFPNILYFDIRLNCNVNTAFWLQDNDRGRSDKNKRLILEKCRYIIVRMKSFTFFQPADFPWTGIRGHLFDDCWFPESTAIEANHSSHCCKLDEILVCGSWGQIQTFPCLKNKLLYFRLMIICHIVTYRWLINLCLTFLIRLLFS